MKTNILYIAVLSFLATACNIVDINPVQGGEEQAPAANMIIETVSGTTEMATKATIANSDGAFAWTAGDNIAVHVSNGKYVFTSDTEHGASGASTNAGTASFTIAYDEGYSRDAFAVYPSTIVKTDAANYGQEDHTLDVTLPSSYTLAEVSGETSPCPMIASNKAGYGWDFKQLCGLLRLSIINIPPSAKRLEIDFDGKKVWGDFQAEDPSETPGTPVVTAGKAVISTSADDTHDIIKITKNGSNVTLNEGTWLDRLVVNIPLPVGTYTNLTVTAYDALTDGNAVLTMTRSFAYNASRLNGTKKNATFPVFSVSAEKRVIFAPGNLQATTTDLGANWTWGFAPNQYSFISATGSNQWITGNKTVSKNGTVDLFGFSTTSNYFGISDSDNANEYSGDYLDFGTIRTFSYKGISTTYTSNYWFTLSQSEWKYLLGEDTPHRNKGGDLDGENALCTKAIINADDGNGGVKGFIIFPDNYAGPTTNTSDISWDYDYISHGDMEHSGASGWGASITSNGWILLQSEGCVFLPVAGMRLYGSYVLYEENGTYYQTDHMGAYMSKTSKSETEKYALRFTDFKWGNILPGFDPDQSYYKHYGVSVRLVHQIN